MSELIIQDTSLTAIANAIRAKTGGTDAMTPAQMVEAINGMRSTTDIAPVVKQTVQNSSSSTSVYSAIFHHPGVTSPKYILFYGTYDETHYIRSANVVGGYIDFVNGGRGLLGITYVTGSDPKYSIDASFYSITTNTNRAGSEYTQAVLESYHDAPFRMADYITYIVV